MSDQPLALGVLYPGDYLKADDLGGREITVAIDRIWSEAIPLSNGKKEPRALVSFVGKRKKLVACKTNGYAIALLLSPDGSDLRGLRGKRITLVADLDRLGRDTVSAIRVCGSPDALPERAEAFARAWKGVRERGALIGRIKLAIQRIRKVTPPPIEPEDVAPLDDDAGPVAMPVDESFATGDGSG